MHAAAPAGAILTLAAAAIFGIAGFTTYAEGVMSDTGRLQIEIAEAQIRGAVPETPTVSSGPMAVALLTPIAFVFLTATGQVTAYLTASSLVRLLVWVTDGPIGDP